MRADRLASGRDPAFMTVPAVAALNHPLVEALAEPVLTDPLGVGVHRVLAARCVEYEVVRASVRVQPATRAPWLDNVNTDGAAWHSPTGVDDAFQSAQPPGTQSDDRNFDQGVAFPDH